MTRALTHELRNNVKLCVVELIERPSNVSYPILKQSPIPPHSIRDDNPQSHHTVSLVRRIATAAVCTSFFGSLGYDVHQTYTDRQKIRQLSLPKTFTDGNGQIACASNKLGPP